MSLLKLFQVQGRKPKCESVKMSDYNCVVNLNNIFKTNSLVIYCTCNTDAEN